MINRQFFIDYARQHLFNGSLKAGPVSGFTAILDYWESNSSKKDDRWLAYALATAHHETDRTFRGSRNMEKGRNKEYGKIDPETRKAYYGRGLVQLTWRKNYKKMGDLLGVDLVRRPEQALDIKIATAILFIGMTRGSFTGKKFCRLFQRWNGRLGQRTRVSSTARTRPI